MGPQVDEWVETGYGWMEDEQKGECTNRWGQRRSEGCVYGWVNEQLDGRLGTLVSERKVEIVTNKMG